MLSGEKILVTGPTGQVAFPIVRALAKGNDVYGLARFSNPEGRAKLEALGVHCLAMDLCTDPLEALPDDFTYVFHFASVVMDHEASWEYAFELNVQATGRLMYRLRNVKGFFHCSTAAAYQTKGREPLFEDDPPGDTMRLAVPTYSLTKMAAEQVVEFASRQWKIPTVVARLGVPYGPTGGLPAIHLSWLVRDKPLRLHADSPTYHNPVYEDDYVEQAIKLAPLGRVPPLVVNWGGSERVSAEEWCEYLARLLGKEPRFDFKGWPVGGLWMDIGRLISLGGEPKVHWRDGMRRMIQARYPDLTLRDDA